MTDRLPEGTIVICIHHMVRQNGYHLTYHQEYTLLEEESENSFYLVTDDNNVTRSFSSQHFMTQAQFRQYTINSIINE